MEENEDKGFKVKDRRKVSLEEEEAGGPNVTAKEEESAKAKFEEASRESGRGGRVPLPEVSLSTFIFSLSSSALVHLGEIPEPDTQHVHTDLPMAKQIIDTLGMLQEKTRGNLEPDEERLLNTVLYDLRLRYVQKSGK